MVGRALADTGFIHALLDTRDRWHARCMATLTSVPFPLVTSEAVLTELFYMSGGGQRMKRAWGWVRSGILEMAMIGHAELAELERLMVRYRDRPMDFADATLVHLAGREGISVVLTIDNDDFETYRIGKRRFRILPGR